MKNAQQVIDECFAQPENEASILSSWDKEMDGLSKEDMKAYFADLVNDLTEITNEAIAQATLIPA